MAGEGQEGLPDNPSTNFAGAAEQPQARTATESSGSLPDQPKQEQVAVSADEVKAIFGDLSELDPNAYLIFPNIRYAVSEFNPKSKYVKFKGNQTYYVFPEEVEEGTYPKPQEQHVETRLVEYKVLDDGAVAKRLVEIDEYDPKQKTIKIAYQQEGKTTTFLSDNGEISAVVDEGDAREVLKANYNTSGNLSSISVSQYELEELARLSEESEEMEDHGMFLRG